MTLIGLAAFALAPQAAAPFHVAAAVSMAHQHCVYWTGDVGLSAKQFRQSLHDSATVGGTVTIYHGGDVSAHCLESARRLAARAGFADIRLETGRIDLSVP